MTKQVFIINGSGGVGKDTVCSAAAQSWKVQNISSITPILQVAKAAGWDGTKTPAARRFLSQLKADCTEFNDLPFRYCTEQLQIFAENDAELLFVHIREPEECKELLINSIKEQMDLGENAYEFEHRKSVVLVIGVNGVGKTTSVGKLAGQLKDDGRRVILAAADTFRAAAIEQLTEWASRAGVELIAQQEGSDPAAVIYDAVAAAKSRKADVLICDTAGRLHNKKNLMEELKKINRIIDKEYPDAYRETLVVLDGTTGQNALAQARQFMEVADITGIILTKLDGTAKGGIAVAIQSELGIPVKYIGIGEKIDDLQKFNADDFVNALFHVQKQAEENPS